MHFKIKIHVNVIRRIENVKEDKRLTFSTRICVQNNQLCVQCTLFLRLFH